MMNHTYFKLPNLKLIYFDLIQYYFFLAYFKLF